MGRAMAKRSVTLDPDVAAAVDRHVESGAAESFSAAINDAAFRWAANQDLRAVLDEIYTQDPSARPDEAQLVAARERLEGLRG